MARASGPVRSDRGQGLRYCSSPYLLPNHESQEALPSPQSRARYSERRASDFCSGCHGARLRGLVQGLKWSAASDSRVSAGTLQSDMKGRPRQLVRVQATFSHIDHCMCSLFFSVPPLPLLLFPLLVEVSSFNSFKIPNLHVNLFSPPH